MDLLIVSMVALLMYSRERSLQDPDFHSHSTDIYFLLLTLRDRLLFVHMSAICSTMSLNADLLLSLISPTTAVTLANISELLIAQFQNQKNELRWTDGTAMTDTKC